MTSDPAALHTVDVELGDAWAYGAGVLHGGWLLETLAAAALERTTHPHPLAVSAQFSSRAEIGAAQVEVERVREGRSVSSLRARLLQGGRARVDVLLSAGTLPGEQVAPYRVDAEPPALPDPDDCVVSGPPPGHPRNGIVEQLDVRVDPATGGFLRGEPGGGTEVRAWVRTTSGREPDPLLLLTVADALPPVTFELGLPGWVPTVELTVHLRTEPAPGWLRCVQRATVLHGGWLDEECQVWDSAGRLVAQARQLAAYRGAQRVTEQPRLGTPLTRTSVDIDPSWSIGGRPHGGYLLSTLAATALDEHHPHPMAVSAHYVASPSETRAVVEVERLRTGRRVASSRLRLLQDDDVKVEVLLSSGRWSDDAEPYWSSPGGPPELPPLEDCPRAPSTGPGGRHVGQLDHCDLRPDPATVMWAIGQPAGAAEVRAWIRRDDGADASLLDLLVFADALPPVTFDLGLYGWVPTLELTVLLRGLPAPGWVRAVQRARLLQDGWLDEECELWDSRDRLVAQARQLAGYRTQ